MTDLNINLKGIKMMKEKTIFPQGEYKFLIEHIEKKATKSGSGSFLTLKFRSLIGPTEGSSLWHNINIENSNLKAQSIGLSELKTLAYAAQLPNYEYIKTTEDLIGKTFIADVDIEDKGDQFGPKNIIKEYRKLETNNISADKPGDMPF